MHYRFELRTDLPILINIFGSKFSADDIPLMAAEAAEWMKKLEHPVYYLNNVGDVRMSLGDIMQGVQLAARGTAPPLHHPNIIETIVVTSDPMIIMAARSLDSYVFGKLKLKVFATLEEALVYIDEKVAI